MQRNCKESFDLYQQYVKFEDEQVIYLVPTSSTFEPN